MNRSQASAQAFLNGQWVGPAEWNVSISDAGFVMGATVVERIRTFDGRLFRLDAHLQRLFHSLQIVDLELGYSADEIAAIADDVVERNHAQLAPGDDLGVGIFVTPGELSPTADGSDIGSSDIGPMVCVYPYLLRFDLWAEHFETGRALVVSDVVQISPRSWPPELKCRSRMHYYLADKRARAVDPQASAVLLDDEGFVTEASTANVAIYYQNEGLVSPRRDRILPGISLGVLAELAAQLGVPFQERMFAAEELRQADEVMLTSTSFCVQPVVRVDNQGIGIGKPGPTYRRLLSAWSELVGLDIASQARQSASRAVQS